MFKSIRHKSVFFILLTVLVSVSFAQGPRHEVDIPDIPGYMTMTSDLHMHTVFSDGAVWPTVRTTEAWLEGLDVFSITDHLEYQPKRDDVKPDHNRGYEIARSGAKGIGLIIIRGTEVTRKIPPGHLNAIFIRDANAMAVEDWKESLRIAADQGAFIFFNHPGWYHKDGISRWYDEHDTLLKQGRLHGVEIVNGGAYYPEAHQWCIDKKITLIGTSDIHSPIHFGYDFSRGEHRPMTLAFVTEKTEAGYRDALFSRRTAVYWKDKLIGDARFLEPVFQASVEVLNPGLTIEGKGRANIHLHNRSEVDLILESNGECNTVAFPSKIILPAHRTVLLRLTGKQPAFNGKRSVKLPVKVINYWVAPETALESELEIPLIFEK